MAETPPPHDLKQPVLDQVSLLQILELVLGHWTALSCRTVPKVTALPHPACTFGTFPREVMGGE